ncbi:sulfotransferase [Chachezhania sediminis]|uniref:sulfotransferase n=1 Tax=Chachezhania sediminis TaxID=2599291 RepID=UPI0018EF0931|nr:sulfotransferase [Chachezhania sediminis]
MTPNFFIIGAPKCGTSALAQYLDDHANVFFCNPKEPFYFSDDYPELSKQHELDDDESYLRLFAAADPAVHKAVGEGSTNYLASHRAIPRILEMVPDARFIVMLRDPIQVAHAFHMEQIWDRNEDEEDFRKAWALQDARARGENLPETCLAPQFLQYRDVAGFSEQIERFFALVPADRRLVLFQEDLKTDPRSVYVRTLAFLGLDDDGRDDFPVVNASHKHRFESVANLVLRPPKWIEPAVWRFRTWARNQKPWYIEAIKEKLRVKSKRAEISPEFETELRIHFSSEVERLEALLGTDLSHWKPGPTS